MKPIYKLLLAAVPVVLVAACGGGDDSLDDRLDIADPKVRFVHAIPAGPNVDLLRNGTVVGGVANAPYKYASHYFDVDTAPADYTVRTTTGNVTVGTINFNPTRGNKHTLIAVPGDATTPNLLRIDDPYDKQLTATNGRVRVVNASFNATNVDVYLTGPTVDIATVGPNFAAVGFRNAVPASGSNSNDFTAGSYVLRVTTAGTKNVIFSAPVSVATNADLLLLTLPNSLAPNDVKILSVTADSGQASTEIFNTP
ncbi:MAG TPA: DUF4397 domain-containing protein [Rhizobacter sp.]|nr:DUF4397 domain-containing protein [Rhizobacter sp.]